MSRNATRTLRASHASPADLSARDLDEFRLLVLSCGEVQPRGLADLIATAYRLARVHEGGQLLGVAGLKVPRVTYRNRVFKAAGTDTDAAAFGLEFGWVCVRADVRDVGVGSLVTAEALGAAGGHPVFATCRTENAPMQHVLRKNGFVQLGEPYLSKLGGYTVSLLGFSVQVA